MSNFDNKARTWDENPVHLERSQAIARKMEEIIPLKINMNALELGAGTGILSFLLADKLNHITMMDSSSEMVKVTEEKIHNRQISNLSAIYCDLEKETPDGLFDLIFNQMVLHHIENIESIFGKFYQLLQDGGFLAIADLYLEDGSFHGEGFNGHLGFDPAELTKKLTKAGFKDVKFEQCYVVKRVISEEETRSYPVFLLTATK